MKPRFLILISLALSLALLCPSLLAEQQCKESWTLANKLIKTGMVFQVRNDFREWLVTNAWYGLTLPDKERTIKVFSAIREKCDGRYTIEVLHARTGKKLAKFGPFGLKIYP